MALLKLHELKEIEQGTIKREILIGSENIENAYPVLNNNTRIETNRGKVILVKENLGDIIEQAQTGKPKKTIIGSKKTPGLTLLS